MSCIRNDCAVVFKRFQDLISVFCPDERLGVLIVDLKVVSDRFLQRLRAAMSAPPDLLARNGSKPSLNLIDPGGAGRGEMQMIARAARQPVVDPGCLAGPVVVQHQVDVEFGGDHLVDSVEKLLELD